MEVEVRHETVRACGGPLGTGKGGEKEMGHGCAHGTSYPF